MALKQKVAPAVEPLSLNEVKLNMRVDVDDDDTLIHSKINGVRIYCELFQNRAYITQTWELWLNAWPDKNYIEIPLPPLQEPVVTAGSFVTGTVYRILTVGTTNFIAIGAASNTIGTIFKATGAGSGTGTATASVIIKYYGTDDTEYFLDGSSYSINNKDQYAPTVYLKAGKSWPSTTLRPYIGICITFIAGYGDTQQSVPENVKNAMLLLIGDLYEHRENTITGVNAVVKERAEDLLSMERVL